MATAARTLSAIISNAMGIPSTQDMAWDKPSGDRGNTPNGNPKNNSDQSGGWDGGGFDLNGMSRWVKRLNELFGGGGGGTFIGLTLVVVALWALMGVYQLNQQERAVVLRFGKFHALVYPGLRWNPWLIDRVHKVNVTKVYSEPYTGHMLTRDENIVLMKITAQYRISGPRNFVLSVRRPIDSLRNAMGSALRHVVGGSTVDEVITYGREAVSAEVLSRLQSYLNLYNTGIVVAQINVNEAAPPQEVKAAFDDVNKALEDEARYINEAEAYANEVVPRARGLAKRAEEEAEGYRQRVIARAEGDVSRFNQLLAEYRADREVMRERLYLETVEEVLSNTSKILIDSGGDGNQIFYLPLDQLLQQAGQTRAATENAQDFLDESVINELARRISNRIGSQQRRTR